MSTSPAPTLTATIPHLFERNATEHRDHPALTADGRTWSWGEAAEAVQDLAAGFADLGLQRGQTVVLMMSNGAEQWLADVAATHLGAVPIAVHPASSSGEIRDVTRHSRAHIAVLGNVHHVRRWSAALREPDALGHVIVVDEAAVPAEDTRFRTWATLRERGGGLLRQDPELVRRRTADVVPDDPVTVLYSPDAIGMQRAVVLTHRNVLAAASARQLVTGAPPHAGTLCYLPMAHMSERAGNVYSAIHDVAHVHFCNGIAEAVRVLPQVRPHTFFGVPRMWERLAALARAQPTAHTAAEKHEVLSGLGLDGTVWGASGGAPLRRDLLELFSGLGFDIFETWGSTESSGWATTNRPGAVRFGTVGTPLPGVEVRIEKDGEVLVRGPVVCAGHLQEDGLVRAAAGADGWLRTGDVGHVDDGYLTITDRKSELIINSHGETVAPSVVENALRAHPLIGHALAFGDGRPHVVALVVLDEDTAPAWASAHGIGTTDLAELARDAQVLAEVDRAVDAANAALGSSGQVRAHRVLDRPWGAAGGELSPALKLRRRVIHTKYAEVLDELYG
ncbi:MULTISPECIES: long-chain fatty acid--CoA ligase [unclassified Saccharopolyspora]|uniref:AMP-dependent synthetase/ligase n=1 Tax=unclassified Saccharopolyspora TaxID=2646250 RepID=UPI001CD3A2E7|nr:MULTISPECIES: AMP-dependent synthetase/ligase [unclassified Saccharopolyspora]MCA1226951.1 AMP-dependent synthetase/ligase [Saccharopolyspora sp. 6M]MCA1282146.1 AMP-dependent synthetase/ligase [Saccharopolyspora sp. 7B]